MLATWSSDFKYLPSEIKGRVLHVLHDVLRKIVSALGGGTNAVGNGRRSARGNQRSADSEEGGYQPQQGQADLPLRNAYKMAVYLLFSAAFPSEECYSSAKQVVDRCMNHYLVDRYDGLCGVRGFVARRRYQQIHIVLHQTRAQRCVPFSFLGSIGIRLRGSTNHMSEAEGTLNIGSNIYGIVPCNFLPYFSCIYVPLAPNSVSRPNLLPGSGV